MKSSIPNETPPSTLLKDSATSLRYKEITDDERKQKLNSKITDPHMRQILDRYLRDREKIPFNMSFINAKSLSRPYHEEWGSTSHSGDLIKITSSPSTVTTTRPGGVPIKVVLY